MANDLTQNPMIVDTQGASDLLSGQALALAKIEWVGATLAGHRAAVKDADGKIVYEGYANGANFTDRVHFPEYPSRIIHGLIVDDLDSGKLYIHYR